jgi:hypothetical protein
MSPRERTAEAPALKIVTQYWQGNTRVCEFAKSDLLLDIYIWSSKDPSRPGDWCVEARNSHGEAGVRISEQAATRDEAFSAVAREWTSRGPALGLAPFDWELVRAALRAVSAIES